MGVDKFGGTISASKKYLMRFDGFDGKHLPPKPPKTIKSHQEFLMSLMKFDGFDGKNLPSNPPKAIKGHQ
ncbi:MAG: hypothetical protein J5980_12135 [Muribaculaceae bacterium]|nr:hypothetical protein [Muribaculaceae bacterium]